ncbi:hypothetical protein PVK06_034030 [Gossypium arboreum]|uniref:Uncharacterized protein n=1 Tax=Gossypium arboreum TaxID=29729 RepID=A0ABR0NF72_GOSAR|nr:hypothetical protein PVK06_034030 [Gossypium arboreum]
MDDFYYLWYHEDFDYDEDIYEERVYEDWEIQENQHLLILELSQLRGETIVLPQDFNDHDDMPSERYQEVLSPVISWARRVVCLLLRCSCVSRTLLGKPQFHRLGVVKLIGAFPRGPRGASLGTFGK